MALQRLLRGVSNSSFAYPFGYWLYLYFLSHPEKLYILVGSLVAWIVVGLLFITLLLSTEPSSQTVPVIALMGGILWGLIVVFRFVNGEEMREIYGVVSAKDIDFR
ncbi:MAG: hypothetical protein K6L73_08510 [Cellvibrionaceae bacterium]